LQKSYTCQCGSEKLEARLSVVEAPLRFVKTLWDRGFALKEKCVLECELNKGFPKVIWTMDGTEIKPDRRRAVKMENKVCLQY